MNEDFSDILYLLHPVSKNHPPMSLHDRAAQFAPFAALTGYEDLIDENARFTEERPLPDEDAKEEINSTLQALLLASNASPEIRVIYFLPDERKSGGALITHTGPLAQIKPWDRLLLFADGTAVPLDDILSISKM